MYLSLGEAAKQTGKSKATISKYIKKGDLSANKNNAGYFEIEPSELFRVFPKGEQQTGVIEQSQTPKMNTVNSALEKEIELLRERLADKDSVISDLRKRLDGENEERRKLTTMLLTDMRDKSPEKPSERPKRFLGIFSRQS